MRVLEAIELAASAEYDVVLLDIGLPGMDGYEVAARIRGSHEGERIVVVALTGYGTKADILRSEHAGLDYHLVKPVDPDLLESLLAEWSFRTSSRQLDTAY